MTLASSKMNKQRFLHKGEYSSNLGLHCLDLVVLVALRLRISEFRSVGWVGTKKAGRRCQRSIARPRCAAMRGAEATGAHRGAAELARGVPAALRAPVPRLPALALYINGEQFPVPSVRDRERQGRVGPQAEGEKRSPVVTRSDLMRS